MLSPRFMCSMHLALLFSPHRVTSLRNGFSFSRAFWDCEKGPSLAMGCRKCDLFVYTAQRCYSSLKPWENSQSPSCVQLYVVAQFHCLKSLTPCSSSKSPFEGNIHCLSCPSPTLSCWVPFLSLQCQGYAAGKSFVFACFPTVWPAAKSNCSSRTGLSHFSHSLILRFLSKETQSKIPIHKDPEVILWDFHCSAQVPSWKLL